MNPLFLLLSFLIFTSCSESDNPDPTPFLGEAMTMPYRVLLGERLSWEKKREVKTLIARSFDEVDRIYNKWNPDSEVSKLNRCKSFVKIPLSPDLQRFLTKTGLLVKATEGRFDPTIETVQKLWKEKLLKGQIPTHEEIMKSSLTVGWSKVHWENGWFWKEHDEVQLDLGGIAKGFAIDLLIERLNEAGYRNVYVEWGGEIRVSGQHPRNRPWKIAVSKLGGKSTDETLALVDLVDHAIATSGDYLQQWTVDGITYYHIIDPRSCCPLIAKGTTVCSATIIARTCMEADALATAAMTFSCPELAGKWLARVKENMPEMQFWVHSRNSGTGTHTPTK